MIPISNIKPKSGDETLFYVHSKWVGGIYLVTDPLTKLNVLAEIGNKYVAKRDGIGPGLSGSGSYLEPSKHLVLQGLLAGGWAETLEAGFNFGAGQGREPECNAAGADGGA